MGATSKRLAGILTLTGALFVTHAPSAQAFHLYRSTDGGCAPADGALTDDAQGTVPTGEATVVVGHNTFSEGISGLAVVPVETRVPVGTAVTWTWNSAHCHSVTSTTDGLFDSGFLYPTEAPESPQVAPGAFDYPLLDDTPTLSFTHTFTEPGTYEYFCVHHAVIGMTGTIVVEGEATTQAQSQTAPWLALPTLRAYLASTPLV